MIDVMIQKSWINRSSQSLHRVLFQPDCNFAFRHIGREMMHKMEQAQALAPK
jgi:hypothetical protein